MNRTHGNWTKSLSTSKLKVRLKRMTYDSTNENATMTTSIANTNHLEAYLSTVLVR